MKDSRKCIIGVYEGIMSNTTPGRSSSHLQLGTTDLEDKEVKRTISMSYGLGFSHKEVKRRCNSLVYGDRFKNSHFKKIGRTVMLRVRAVNTLRRGEEEENNHKVTVIGGKKPVINLLSSPTSPTFIKTHS